MSTPTQLAAPPFVFRLWEPTFTLTERPPFSRSASASRAVPFAASPQPSSPPSRTRASTRIGSFFALGSVRSRPRVTEPTTRASAVLT